MTQYFMPVLAASAISLSTNLQGASLEITGTISNTVGTTTNIPGSGDANNTTPWATGTVGVFEMNGGAYFMRVSATNPTGNLLPANDSLMVARTTNSQGLTDTGTLSVYVRPNTTGGWALDMNFSFFSDAGLTVPAPFSLLLTSLDIDFNQRYYTSDTTFSENIVASGTNLSLAPAVTGYSGFTASGDATFSDPKFAVASAGTGSSFDIRMGHNNVALFMFEFRNPSTVTGLVPEPSVALLGGLGALALLRRRR